MNRLGKYIGAGSLGLASLVSPLKANMIIESVPQSGNWIADGTTEYRMDVYADSTGIPTETIVSAEWDVVVPSYLTVTRAELPSTNNPSTNVNDFFYNINMNSGFNRVDSTVGSGELTDNVRISNNFVSGAVNKDGLLGSYWFTVNPVYSGPSSFDLNSVYFFNPNFDEYSNDLENVDVVNGGFNVQAVPEPSLGFIGLGAMGYLASRRRK